MRWTGAGFGPSLSEPRSASRSVSRSWTGRMLRQVQIGVGAFLVLYGIYSLARPTLGPVRVGGAALDSGVGFLNGALAGVTGLAGILVVIWCGLRGWPKDVQRGVFQPAGVATFAMTALWLGAKGAIATDTLTLFLLGLPVLLAGTWLGLKLYGRIDEAGFRRIVLVLLLLSGFCWWLRHCGGDPRGLTRGRSACPQAADRVGDMRPHRLIGRVLVAGRNRLDHAPVLVVARSHVALIARHPMQRDTHLVLERAQDLLQSSIAGRRRDRPMQLGIGAEVAGRILVLHRALLVGQNPAQAIDARLVDALGAQPRRACLEEFAHLMDRHQVARFDRRHHDAAPRLLDREPLRHQAEHGLAHRAARHVEPACQLGHAERLAGTQRSAEDGVAQRILDRVDDPRRRSELRQIAHLSTRLPSIDPGPAVDHCRATHHVIAS